jgi:hypothetical protein
LIRKAFGELALLPYSPRLFVILTDFVVSYSYQGHWLGWNLEHFYTFSCPHLIEKKNRFESHKAFVADKRTLGAGFELVAVPKGKRFPAMFSDIEETAKCVHTFRRQYFDGDQTLSSVTVYLLEQN